MSASIYNEAAECYAVVIHEQKFYANIQHLLRMLTLATNKQGALAHAARMQRLL